MIQMREDHQQALNNLQQTLKLQTQNISLQSAHSISHGAPSQQQNLSHMIETYKQHTHYEFQQQIHAKDNEIQQLKKQVQSLQSQNQKMIVQVETLQKSKKTLEKRLMDISDHIIALKDNK